MKQSTKTRDKKNYVFCFITVPTNYRLTPQVLRVQNYYAAEKN